jgi:transcriptional regulator with XRE-family HTH domain
MLLFKDALKEKIALKYGEYGQYAHFAADMNVSRPTVSQWIKGDNLPDEDNIIRISNLLGWDYADARQVVYDTRKAQMDSSLTVRNTKAVTISGLDKVLERMRELPERKQAQLVKMFQAAIDMCSERNT